MESIEGKIMNDTEVRKSVQYIPNDLLVSWKRVNGTIVGIFVFVIISVFPLVFHDFYFDILNTKYRFYYVSVLLTVITMLLVAVIFIVKDGKYYQWQNLRQIRVNLNIKSIRGCDWAMIVFVAASIVSTFQSEYFYEAFWGNEGRYMGLFLILLYGASYFMISRFLVLKKWYIDAFLVSGMIACIIGLLQYFKLDPLGFKAEIDASQFGVFTSTIGNINVYTSYVALIAGASIIMFISEINVPRRRWYLFAVVVSLLALMTGISDNAYLAMLAVFGLLPLYLFNNLKGIKKYILLVSLLASGFQIVEILNSIFPERVLGINGLFDVIAGNKYLPIMVAVLWCVTAILYQLDARLDKRGTVRKDSNTGRWIWLVLIALGIVGVSYALYDVNILGNVERYGSLSSYLQFNDDWGSHRGYIWRLCMESYQRFPALHKIFGYGPDTFGIITVDSYYDEMVSKYNEIYDSVHNEYLQYLITIGIAGMVSYLLLLVASIIRMIRTAGENPVLIAIAFALICYGAQAVVNISLPIVAPIMMTLLMMGVSMGRDVKKETLSEEMI